MVGLQEDALANLLVPWVTAGQRSLANALRESLRERAPKIASLGLDDDAILEPAAFAAVADETSPATAFEAVYAGATPALGRPARLSLTADDRGRVFLPGLGFIVGLGAAEQVDLDADQTSCVGYRGSGTAVALEDWRVLDPRLALLPFPVPALERAGRTHPSGLPRVQASAVKGRVALATSLQNLRIAWPALADLVNAVTRYVVLFEGPGQNSFAKTSAHGVVFLNLALGDTEAFFIEDLAHQCGHLIFTAVLEGSPSLVSVPATTRVRDLTGQEDHRTVEVALHGMVTQTLMTAALGRLMTAGLALDREEAHGRLLFALARLGLDLRALAPLPVFTDAGATLLHSLLLCYRSAAQDYGSALAQADFSDQPYNFDYRKYLARRPTTAR